MPADLADFLGVKQQTRQDPKIPTQYEDLESVEAYFATAATPKKQATINITPIIDKLINATKSIETDSAGLSESTKLDMPHGQIVLTKALVYLIEKYGIDYHYHINRYGLAVLKDPRILELAYKNNHELIYRINIAVKKKKEEDDTKAREEIYRNRLSKLLKDEALIEKRVKSFSRFYKLLESEPEDKAMRTALDGLIEDFGGVSKRDQTILNAYMLFGRYNWTFLNAVYSYYRDEGILGLDDFYKRLKKIQQANNAPTLKDNKKSRVVDDLMGELQCVEKTHANTLQRTIKQSIWISIGGFAFGMELVMLPLETFALNTLLSPLHILLVSIAAGILAGPMIAGYFLTGHYDELYKQNQSEYFEENSPQKPAHKAPTENSFAEVVARIGTLEEGCAAGALLLTLGAFVGFDLVSLAIVGGEYTSALPGQYFVTEVLMKCDPGFYVLTAVAVGALLYATYQSCRSLASAHYALDGKNTLEFFHKFFDNMQMRGVVNKETKNPVFFSRPLELQHQAGKKLTEFKEVFWKSPKPVLA